MSEPVFDAARYYADYLGGPPTQFNRGFGHVIGLIDGSIDVQSPDLCQARIELRDFVGTPDISPSTINHGTNMAMLLVGQGKRHICGMVPEAQLLAARAIGPADSAMAENIGAAIDWLVEREVRIIAMPVGSESGSEIVCAAIRRAVGNGARIFAASGCGPGMVLFPARHTLVLAVGPAGRDGRPLPETRWKPKLDLLAPGHNIPQLSVDRTLRSISGSSIACVLAAAAALANS